MRFTGFDSAWGGKQKGALCDLILDGNCLSISKAPRSVTWDEACEEAMSYQGESHVLAIDQGLLVPNEKGMRPVERNIAKSLMADYKCGAHSSNTGNTSCYGNDAGIWKLLSVLNDRGFQQSPMEVVNATNGKYFFECYPNLAILGLFGVRPLLQYKHKKKCVDDWRELLRLIRELKEHELAVENVDEFFASDFAHSKQNEDHLDAFVSAYTAAYWWRFGTERNVCIGNLQTGYVVTPTTSEMLECFKANFAPSEINPHGDVAYTFTGDSEPSGQVPTEKSRNNSSGDNNNDAGIDWIGPVELHVNDSGCIWASRNDWIDQSRLTNSRLVMRLIDEPSEPHLTFHPFANHGNVQRGMKPHSEDDRLEWRFIAANTGNQNVEIHRVLYRWIPLEETP